MNRVYKVIWSKAKHCYVVTSEIARSVTKSASSARSAGRKGAAVLAMAALLFTAGGVLGEAANVTGITVNKKGNVITATKDDKSTDIIKINNVAHAKEADYATAATKATSDGNGHVIENTYVKNVDARVGADGEYVKVANTVGKNLSALDTNLSALDKQVKAEAAARKAADTKEAAARKAADTKLQKAVDAKANAADVESTYVKKADAQVTTLHATGTATVDGNAEIGGNLTVDKNLTVNGTFDSKTLSSTVDAKDDYTTINGGNVTSEVNDTVSGVVYNAESIFNKDGSSITVRTNEGSVDSTGNSTVGGKEISQYLGDNAKPEGSQKNVTRKMVRNNDGTFSMEDKAVDGKNKYSTVSQNAGERKVTVIDGNNKASTNLSNNGFNTYASDGKNKTYTKQTATDIKNTAEKGMISHTAKNLVNRAYENMTNTVDKDLTTTVGGNKSETVTGTSTETVTGKKTENYNGGLETTVTGEEKHTVNGSQINAITGSQTNTIGGSQTTTVTGDSSLKAENITNEAKNKITNKARDVETDAASSIVSKVSNAAGSNTSTQWSYQTKEEMSQTDGKTASYLRGAAEEKSQLTDGDKKTTIDTVAGQTNTNITEGKNVSNSLQKADQIASSVTDGTNTTVVNQNAGSLASSITDGTKANNTSSTVDKSEQLIKVDNTHFYAETRTAGTAVETLKSGNTVINIVKDTTTATVSSAVTDEATITGISQNAKDISLSAAGGTITNDANDVLNKGANSVINEVGDKQVAVMTDSVKAAYGLDTYTTWDDKGITSNTSGNMSNSATNITNKADEKLSNSAADIENKASSSIWNHVGKGYNTSWKMTNGKISESIVNGTASNKENTTAEGTKRIITNGEGTGIYNQTATSNNISLKNAAGDTYFTKSESLNGEKTSVKNSNGSSTINQSAESIVNFVKNSEGTTKTEQSAVDIKNTAKNGTITNDAKTLLNKASESITDKVGKTTVTTTDGLTKLTNKKGTHITEMDYANVTKDLTVKGDSDLQGNATVGKNLEVKGTSTLTGDVTMESNATVGNELTVNGESTFNNKVTITKGGLDVTGVTTTDTLHVNGGGYVGGDLKVDGNIETHDAVLSADSRQVVTGRQLYQTNERVDRLDNRIKKVGANAAALAALRPGDFNPDDKFSIAAGFGSYRNANAAALGLFYRPNENVLLSLGTSFGDGENMVNAGVSVKFGRGKSMAERRKEMADEVSSMRDEMRSQDERIAELEEMLKKQSELIEKLSKES